MQVRKRPSGSDRLVVCVRNAGFSASLERRKIYRCIGTERVGTKSLLRIIDESGEAYLYPKSMFASVRLSSAAWRAFALAS